MKSGQGGQEVTKLEALLDGEAAERRALERELREREQRFDAFFSSAPMGLAVLDNTLRYVRINETLAKINGRAPEEHVGRQVREIVPAVAPAVETAIREILETREPVLNLEVTGEAPGEPGRQRTWLLSFVPLAGAAGQTLGVCALVFDVTDRRELERALGEAEAKYRMLLEHSSDAVLVFDEQGEFLEVNPRLYRMLGYEREEFMRLNVHDLLPEEELARLPVNYADLRAGKTVRRERSLRRKDGTLVRVEVIGSMVGEGKMQSVVRELPAKGEVAAAQGGEAETRGSARAGLGLLREMAAALSTAVEFLEGAHASGGADLGDGIEFYEEVSRFESNLIRRALRQTRGNQKKAAELLGVNHTTLHTMMKRYGINPGEFKSADFPRLVGDPRRK